MPGHPNRPPPESALTEATIEILRVLEDAGARLPPPMAVMREWVSWAHSRPTPELPTRWREVPAAVLAAGWAWVRRQSLAWERRQRLAEVHGTEDWAVPLPVHEAAGFRARALSSAGELVDAGLAFHNCLADFVENCAGGTMHVFVIEELATGRSVAVAALTVFATAKRWRLMDVKGLCNAKVAGRIERFAAGLLEAFNQRRAGVPRLIVITGTSVGRTAFLILSL